VNGITISMMESEWQDAVAIEKQLTAPTQIRTEFAALGGNLQFQPSTCEDD
jgi:hypothetical protein